MGWSTSGVRTRTRMRSAKRFLTTRRRYAMPVGRSDGCLSTVWYLARCTMVKTRPAQRNTDAGSISRSAHPRTRKIWSYGAQLRNLRSASSGPYRDLRRLIKTQRAPIGDRQSVSEVLSSAPHSFRCRLLGGDGAGAGRADPDPDPNIY